MLRLKNSFKRIKRDIRRWFEKTVLIMKTDPVTSANLESIFKEIGYKVIVTDSRKFSLIEQCDLVLVDNSIDGFLTATKIRVKNPKQKIIMVASTDELHDEEYIEDEIAVTNTKVDNLLFTPVSTKKVKNLLA